MARVQDRGEIADHRADLCSLGVVLYELLSGRLPFTLPTVMSVLTGISVDQRTPPQPIRARLAAACVDW